MFCFDEFWGWIARFVVLGGSFLSILSLTLPNIFIYHPSEDFCTKFCFWEHFSVTLLLLDCVLFLTFIAVTHSRQLSSWASFASSCCCRCPGSFLGELNELRVTGLNQPSVTGQGWAPSCAFQLVWFTAGSPVPCLYWDTEQHLAEEN